MLGDRDPGSRADLRLPGSATAFIDMSKTASFYVLWTVSLLYVLDPMHKAIDNSARSKNVT